MDPTWPRAHFRLGCAERFIGSLQNAQESFARALSLTAPGDPSLPELQARLDEVGAALADPSGRLVLCVGDKPLCCGDNCLLPGVMSCGACGMEAYCSRECQRGVWPVHKLACKALAEERAAGIEYARPFKDMTMDDEEALACRTGSDGETATVQAVREGGGA